MNRPGILDENDLLGLWVALLDRLIEPQQGLPIKLRALPGDESSGLGIQTGRNAPGGVPTVALVSAGHRAPGWSVALGHGWPAIIGQFVLLQVHDLFGLHPAVPGDRGNALDLGSILPVW